MKLFIPILQSFLLTSLNIYLSPPLNDLSPKLQPQVKVEKQHIVCDKTFFPARAEIVGIAQNYYPSLSSRAFRFIELPSIYALDNSQDAYIDLDPRENPPKHGEFHKMRFASQPSEVTYERYCQLEHRLSKIVRMYIDDHRHHWFLSVDPMFMYSDGLPAYFSKQENHRTLYISRSKDVGYTQLVLWTDEFSDVL